MNSPAQVRIVPATAADVPELIALSEAAGEAAHWSAQHWDDIFDPEVPRRLCWIARAERDTPAGFVVAQCGVTEWELENIAVASGFRRRRIASALLTALVVAARAAGAERILLEVRASNSAAITLYQQAGFELLGRRPGYYRNPSEDALILARGN